MAPAMSPLIVASARLCAAARASKLLSCTTSFAFLPHPHAARFDLGVAVVTVALEKSVREHLQQLARDRPEF
jgi:hypothetical protein